MLELPEEEVRRQTKLDRSLDVEDAVKYLKSIFWVYANNDKFNYTVDQYQAAVKEQLFSYLYP